MSNCNPRVHFVRAILSFGAVLALSMCLVGCNGSKSSSKAEDSAEGGATKGDNQAAAGAQTPNPSGLNADKINAEASQEKHPDGK
jgi:hypothetical protein